MTTTMVSMKAVRTHWMDCTSTANSDIMRGRRRLIMPMLLPRTDMALRETAISTSQACGWWSLGWVFNGICLLLQALLSLRPHFVGGQFLRSSCG